MSLDKNSQYDIEYHLGPSFIVSVSGVDGKEVLGIEKILKNPNGVIAVQDREEYSKNVQLIPVRNIHTVQLSKVFKVKDYKAKK